MGISNMVGASQVNLSKTLRRVPHVSRFSRRGMLRASELPKSETPPNFFHHNRRVPLDKSEGSVKDKRIPSSAGHRFFRQREVEDQSSGNLTPGAPRLAVFETWVLRASELPGSETAAFFITNARATHH